MPKKIFYLVVVTMMLSSVGLANDFEDPSEISRNSWSGSSFAKLFNCKEPTLTCFISADASAMNHWESSLSLMIAIGQGGKLENTVNCLSKVGPMKRSKAFMKWVENNNHAIDQPFINAWSTAMAIHFPRCHRN